MNFSNPLGSVDRFVKDVTHRGQPARVVSGSTVLDADPADLWDAVTNAERIPRWFLPITGDLKVGGQYQLEGHANGEISECQPPETFRITWVCGENVSWVQVKLKADGQGTRLTLEHIMPKDEASEEHWQKFGAGATGVGWDLSLVGLSLHVRTGETVPQEEAHAWMATDDGKQFIRNSAAAWGAAHADSGEDAVVATEMAERTAKFYTGEA